MVQLLFILISFSASVIGCICGIGGGPINLVVLYFFSMEAKTAAQSQNPSARLPFFPGAGILELSQNMQKWS